MKTFLNNVFDIFVEKTKSVLQKIKQKFLRKLIINFLTCNLRF